MQRSRGRSRHSRLRRSEDRALLAAERLEHRLALSATSLAWVEATQALAMNQPPDPSAQVAAEPARAESWFVSRVSAEPWQREYVAPLPFITQGPRVASLDTSAAGSASSPAAISGAIERLPIQFEGFVIGSTSLAPRWVEFKNSAGFDFARIGEPIAITIGRLPLGEHGGIEQGETVPAPHDINSSPQHDAVVTLPGFDGPGKPDNGGRLDVIPSGRGGAPFGDSSPAGGSAMPGDSIAVISAARITTDGAANSASAGHAGAVLAANPFAIALGAVAASEASPVRWLLPYAGSAGATGAANEAESSGATPASQARVDAAETPHVPGLSSAAVGVVANAGQALGLLAADETQRAQLLGNVSLGTEALDQALANVMNEVEQLGGELFTWIDEASIEPWARTAAALAAFGVGSAIAWRCRGKQTEGEQAEAESSTWLFHQLQSSTGGL
ncbi:MAG: hypothetical protein WD845_17225 [Pirellulales bacterium]